MRALAALLLVALAGTAEAAPLVIEGEPQQGALLHGATAPDATVVFDGREVRVTDDGRFVIGFGRDHGPQAVVEVRFADGTTTREVLEVAAREYEVQHIDGLPEEMVTPPAEVLERIRNDAERVRAARAADTPVPWFRRGIEWPLHGPITGVYGSQRILNGQPRQPHFGIDIAAPEGTPIGAAADGIVTLAEELYFTGNTVIIDHGHGLSTTYSHLETMTVAVGDQVRLGQTIGTVGATGRATGPHLDWRLNLLDTRLDPALAAAPMPESG